MKRTNRPTPSQPKLVLRREALVMLGVPELRQVAGASVFAGCTSTSTTMDTRSTQTGGA